MIKDTSNHETAGIRGLTDDEIEATSGAGILSSIWDAVVSAVNTVIDWLGGDFPGWRGPHLPEPIARAVSRSASGAYEGGVNRYDWVPFENRRFLRARPLSAVDRLSPRERQVATLLIEGCTHKDVAARLGLSPNTARTHIALLYKRLGVSNKAQMARMVTEHPEAGAGAGVSSRPTRSRP